MNLFYVSFIVISLLSGCATQQSKQDIQPQKSSPDATAMYKSALQENSPSSKVRKLQRFIKKYPQSDLRDDAHFKLGDIYFSAKQYQTAYRNYAAIYDSEIISPLAEKARLKAAYSLFESEQPQRAIQVTDDLVSEERSNQVMTEAYELRLRALAQLDQKYETLKSLAYLSTQHQSPERRSSYRSLAIEMIETQMSDDELAQLAEDSDFGFLRAYALFRQGELYKEKKDYIAATDALLGVKELLPTSDLAERADLLLKSIEDLKKVDPLTIGAVLPLTGRHAKVAQRVLRGLQLGLGVYGSNPSQFRLAVVDSEGNPDIARRAVERLVTEDHAIAVVGSLLSKTSVAVASKSHEMGVASIGLSQKDGITDTGESVFRNALTISMQIRELVKTAVEELGIQRFAILYPNDNYGVSFANQFWDEVMKQGGEIRAVQTYNPGETDYRTHIQRMIGTYYNEDRVEEYELRLKDWAAKQTRRNARRQPPEDLLPPVVDFEALFIPDSPEKLSQIVPMLRYNDVENIVLLGTNIWNTPNLASRVTNDRFSAVFVDSYFPEDKKFLNSLFWKEYFETFREEPSLFEIHAYDTGLMLRQLILSGANTRSDLVNQLQAVRQFPGSIGPLHINEKREFERPLVTLTMNKGKIGSLVPEAITKKKPTE